MRTRLYAARAISAQRPLRATPQERSFLPPPAVFSQPNNSSTRLRTRWLVAYPACRLVRRLMRAACLRTGNLMNQAELGRGVALPRGLQPHAHVG